MGVGVKRRMPLMLHESPVKKPKSKKPVRSDLDGGPTIHELDNEIEITPEELLEQELEDQPVVSITLVMSNLILILTFLGGKSCNKYICIAAT